MKQEEKKAYLFITLPNTFTPVVCGLIKETANDFLEFVYARSYVKNPDAISIDPIHLPLSDSTLYLGKNDYTTIGAIRDAMPDSWGRFLIEKQLNASRLNEIDYMLHSTGEHVGSLDFCDKVHFLNTHLRYLQRYSLNQLAESIYRMDVNNNLESSDFDCVLQFGSSMGGARPKSIIEDNNAIWLAKFNSKNDSINYTRLEYANMLLAKKVGLNVPDIRLESIGPYDVFLIKRFDREKNIDLNQYYKKHFISALTATGRVESDSHMSSYHEIAGAIRQISSNSTEDLIELYKRMIFNVLCNNTDDHLRNHGFLMDHSGKYRLSPAYDIVPSLTSNYTKYLTLNIGKYGKIATIENIVSSASHFGLSRVKAQNIVIEMQNKTLQWVDIYKKCGITLELIEKLGNPETGSFKNCH